MIDVTHHFAPVGSGRLHYVTAGQPLTHERAPVVLLHGWPQTWFEWRDVMAGLAHDYTLIAIDLPGLGDSSRPARAYDKRSVAADVLELLVGPLALDSFHVVGHDWGGPVAFRVAAAAAHRTRTLTMLDVTVPGIGPDMSQGGVRWHHAFHRTPELPEALTAGREREYLSWFYAQFAQRTEAITPAAVDEYVRCYSQPGAMTSGFEYYRAMLDDAADNRALFESGFRLTMPVLAMGGAVSERRGRGLEPAASLREIADSVTAVSVPDCGHFIPEERADAVVEALREHLAGST